MTTHHRERAGRSFLLILLAAVTAWAVHAQAPSPPSASQLPAQVPPRIEVAFVLDTTGSMAGLIDGAKAKIWSIANRMASGNPQPNVRIGLVGYRDRGDQYVTTRVDLTDDIDAVYERLMAFKAEGGGDTPESVNQALHEAVSMLDWSEGEGVYRVVFLVGDAPPHMDYPDDVSYADSVRLASQRKIAINTVQCGAMAETTVVWREIAGLGHGQYAAIEQDGAMAAVVTPMDDELASLNRELAATALAYGAEEEKAELRQKVARSLAAPPEATASRLSYLDKLGGRLNAGRRDLVDAVKDGLVKLDEVAIEELPAALKPLSREEQATLVNDRIEKRTRIQTRIGELSQDRDDFVRQEHDRLARDGARKGFDAEVFETVKKQAASAGIAYE